MAQAFKLTRQPNYPVNSHGQNQNCYYCTIAALLGTTTAKLVHISETMMQDTANPKEVLQLMKAAGIETAIYLPIISIASLSSNLKTLRHSEGIGLAYTRTNGTGHMIVACKDQAGKEFFIDYQKNPPAIHDSFPEDIGKITMWYLFFYT